MPHKKQFTLIFNQSLDDYIKKHLPEAIEYRIVGESLDARGAPWGKKPRVLYTVEYIKKGESFPNLREDLNDYSSLFEKPPIIIGAGPAGLFSALRFADYGVKSLIFERGDSAKERMKSIAKYWRYGELDPESNVCYGEGGAGLYSDGKLITRVKSTFIQYVMNRLVDFGAPDEIAYTSNPHLGSNKIRSIITKVSQFLIEKGCEFHYRTKITELILENNRVVGVKTNKGESFYSDHIILAIGHSPKDFFQYLEKEGIALKEKDFAIGVRIEHPRRAIDKMQYGHFAEKINEAARYRLSYFDKENKKGTYSFCMCPGGYVLSSGTDEEGIVVNGMSNFARNSPWSNSALVVSVHTQKDIEGESVLKGFDWIEKIENKAFKISEEKSNGRSLPAMYVSEFLKGKLSDKELPHSSSPSHLFKTDLKEIFPQFIVEHLKKGLQDFDRKIKGFIHPDALLIAPETRTSCPVSILRNKDTLESTSHRGLYPCGEGAGYAGGITSAAVDGIKATEAIIKELSKN